MIIGIDFGSTQSAVAAPGVVDVAGGRYLPALDVTILPTPHGWLSFPSVVCPSADDPARLVAGEEAEAVAREGAAAVHVPVTRLGHDGAVDVHGRAFAATDAAAALLRHLRASAGVVLGAAVTRAVIAHPAFFDEAAADALRRAAADAGFRHVELITAADAVASARTTDVGDDGELLLHVQVEAHAAEAVLMRRFAAGATTVGHVREPGPTDPAGDARPHSLDELEEILRLAGKRAVAACGRVLERAGLTARECAAVIATGPLADDRQVTGRLRKALVARVDAGDATARAAAGAARLARGMGEEQAEDATAAAAVEPEPVALSVTSDDEASAASGASSDDGPILMVDDESAEGLDILPLDEDASSVTVSAGAEAEPADEVAAAPPVGWAPPTMPEWSMPTEAEPFDEAPPAAEVRGTSSTPEPDAVGDAHPAGTDEHHAAAASVEVQPAPDSHAHAPAGAPFAVDVPPISLDTPAMPPPPAPPIQQSAPDPDVAAAQARDDGSLAEPVSVYTSAGLRVVFEIGTTAPAARRLVFHRPADGEDGLAVSLFHGQAHAGNVRPEVLPFTDDADGEKEKIELRLYLDPEHRLRARFSLVGSGGAIELGPTAEIPLHP